MANLTSCYGPQMLGFGYGEPGPRSVYTKGYHRGQDIRKLAADGSHSVSFEVVSLSGGVIVDIYTTSVLGWVVVVDTGRKKRRYEAHCHMADISVREGQRVSSGTRLARTAVRGEFTGSGWSGPHDHFVVGDHPDVAHNTARREYDPRPLIAEVLASPASVHTPSDPEEDEFDMDTREKIDALFQELLPGKAGVKTQGSVHKLLGDTLAAARASQGASESLVGDFQAGKAGVRTAGRLLALLTRIADKPAAALSAADVKAIADATAAQIKSGAAVDYDEIAKRVNDESAKRQAS